MMSGVMSIIIGVALLLVGYAFIAKEKAVKEKVQS
jgi:hypothetical protein